MSADGTNARLAGLRRLLSEKFPEAERRPGGVLPTGLPGVDAVEGGLRRAALTEFSGAAGGLFLHALVEAAGRDCWHASLVDAARTFDPSDCAPSALARWLVVWCADADQAVKAADLLLRDGNLALVMLDLQGVPAVRLRRIPAGTWHRFQRLAGQTSAALVVLTPEPFIESAQVRIAGGGDWSLAMQRRWRHELAAEVAWRVFPRRAAPRVAEPVGRATA